MKKIILLIITLVFMTIFISCNSNVSTESNTANVVNNEEVNTIETPDITTKDVTETTEVETEEPILEINKEIPNFSFDLLTGETVDLHDYKGKIIMLNFWASWCTYCDQEMPDLNTVNNYEDVQVFAINSRESEKTIQKYIEEGGYDMDVVIDEVGIFSDLFYITSLPTTYFINEEGILLGAIPGMLTLDKMDLIIQDIRDDNL